MAANPTRDPLATPSSFTCEKNFLRNLVVCIDGSASRFSIENTNIVELYSHIEKNNKQLAFYSSVLGPTTATSSLLHRRLSNAVDVATGDYLYKFATDSYSWLSENYQDGDRIFLFGFSRGAYQVRALAGMIARVGLLFPGNKEQIPFALELYLRTAGGDSPLAQGLRVLTQFREERLKRLKRLGCVVELAKTFQETFCRLNVHVHFVGVWDTLPPRRSNMTTSCDHVCYFRHALALDERRVKFLPEYIYGTRASSCGDGRIKEVWFPGWHFDIGGGNKRNEKLQSGGISLLWMQSQAVAAGLEMRQLPVTWKMDDLNNRVSSSMGPPWWLLEFLPLRHFLYNSDRHTVRPHLGAPRRILPDQKVHASVLFMNDYEPFAERLGGGPWPVPVFWNDVLFRDRLDELPDWWEKELFGKDSFQLLLLDLQGGRPTLDALDRLIFMASFGISKDIVGDFQHGKEILAPFLYSRDRLMRLSTAAVYCVLGWEWLSEMESYLPAQIIQDLSGLLEDNDHRACIYIPFLYKRVDWREQLVNEKILNMLIRLCRSTQIGKPEVTTSTAAFRSSQALCVMMKLNPEFAVNLIKIHAVADLVDGLSVKSDSTLVSILRVLGGIAKHERGRECMKMGPMLNTLLKLIEESDDSVAGAATHVLCSLLPDRELRERMLENEDALGTIFEKLDSCLDPTGRYIRNLWREFAKYDDVQKVLYDRGLLKSLVEQMSSDDRNERDIAVAALVDLGNTRASCYCFDQQQPQVVPDVHSRVIDIMKELKMVNKFVEKLRQKSTALSGATTLAHLVHIDEFAEMVSDPKSGVPSAIVTMLLNRWFDGLRGEDGLQVLCELLKCEPLRLAVLKAGAIGVLRRMIDPAEHESTYTALHYLRVVIGINEMEWFSNNDSSLLNGEPKELIPDIVKALHIPDLGVQRAAMGILRFFSAEANLRDQMVKDMLDMLRGRQAAVVLAVSTVLGLLAVHGSVREKVLMDKAFGDLAGEYYGGFDLGQDKNSRSPSTEEVYVSVGRMIRLMQGPQTESGKGGPRERVIQMAGDNELQWPVRDPYEIKKPKSRWYWVMVMSWRYLTSSPETLRELWGDEW